MYVWVKGFSLIVVLSCALVAKRKNKVWLFSLNYLQGVQLKTSIRQATTSIIEGNVRVFSWIDQQTDRLAHISGHDEINVEKRPEKRASEKVTESWL